MWRLLPVSFLLMAIVCGSYSASNRKTRQLMKEMMKEVASLQDSVSELKGNIDQIYGIEENLTALAEAIKDSNIETGNEKICGKCEVVQRQPSVYDRLIRDKDGYLLAYRLTAGIRKSAFEKYTAVGNNDDENDLVFDNVPCGCKTPDGRLHCDRHYRSRLLDLWPRLPVDKVKVSVYKNGKAKWRMVFDGKNSDYLTFFRQARLIEDPYTDLSSFEPTNPTPKFFSIEGDWELGRRFFIINNYGGCNNDAGWLDVGDRPTPACSWEKEPARRYPFILYATTKSRTHSGKGKYEKANYNLGSTASGDVLTVSIKLRERGECRKSNLWH